MIKRIGITIVLFYINLMLFGCSGNGDDFQGDFTFAEFNNVIQLFVPSHYNKQTGCYLLSNNSKKFDNNPIYQPINSFRIGEETRIGFLVFVKPKHRVVFSGIEGLDLFRLDDDSGQWEEKTISANLSSSSLVNGDILESNSLFNFGREKCHFFPSEPMYITFENQNQLLEGKYRLYTWGFELEKNGMTPTTFVGDYVEFELVEK